jgi:hypothetical protein
LAGHEHRRLRQWDAQYVGTRACGLTAPEVLPEQIVD